MADSLRPTRFRCVVVQLPRKRFRAWAVDIIGDVVGSFDEMNSLLPRVEQPDTRLPPAKLPSHWIAADQFSSEVRSTAGPKIPEVLRLVMVMVKAGIMT
jgi:hypothetical protein